MRRIIRIAVFSAGTVVLFAEPLPAQENVGQRLDRLAKQVQRLESRIDRTTSTSVLFLFGTFCALWAQNTNRNPWVWFFAGLLLNVITVLVLLAKNADDRRVARGEPAGGPIWVIAAVGLGILLAVAAAVWLFFAQAG